jgi:hypothetical protein
VCGEGEPPREEHATVCRSAPLHLRKSSGLASNTGPGPTSHAPWVPISVCGEGELPREEHATVCRSTPLHLRRNQQPSLWHGSPGPRVEKSNHRSRQHRPSSGPPQKTEKVDFQNQCSGIEAPRAWPSKTIKYEGDGSVNRRDRRDSWRDRRWTDGNYDSERTEASSGFESRATHMENRKEQSEFFIFTNFISQISCQSPTKLWPQLQARSLT